MSHDPIVLSRHPRFVGKQPALGRRCWGSGGCAPSGVQGSAALRGGARGAAAPGPAVLGARNRWEWLAGYKSDTAQSSNYQQGWLLLLSAGRRFWSPSRQTSVFILCRCSTSLEQSAVSHTGCIVAHHLSTRTKNIPFSLEFSGPLVANSLFPIMFYACILLTV